MKKMILAIVLLSISVMTFSRTIHNEEYFKIWEQLPLKERGIFDKVIHEKYNQIDENKLLIESMSQMDKLSMEEKNTSISKLTEKNIKIEKEIVAEMEKFKKLKLINK